MNAQTFHAATASIAAPSATSTTLPRRHPTPPAPKATVNHNRPNAENLRVHRFFVFLTGDHNCFERELSSGPGAHEQTRQLVRSQIQPQRDENAVIP